MLELSKKDLIQLAHDTGFPRVSVYLPMEAAGREIRKNPIILKNAAAQAKRRLLAGGVSESVARGLVQTLLDMADDNNRMQHQMSGLAVFLSPASWQEMQLPVAFQERIVVSDRFYIRPLVEPVTSNIQYAILALSEGGVALYQADNFHLQPVDVPELPEDLCTVLRFDDFEKSLQPHQTETGGSRYGVHGHGAGKDEHELFLKRFVDAVTPAVERILAGKPLPLALVGAEDVIGRVAKALDYPHILPDRLVKDPHAISADELLREGRRLAGHEVEQQKSALLERAESSHLTQNPHGVVEAAVEARVDVLIVDRDAEVRGRWIPSEGVHVETDSAVAAEAEDLVDLAMIKTLEAGGEVIVQASRDAPLAALLRD